MYDQQIIVQVNNPATVVKFDNQPNAADGPEDKLRYDKRPKREVKPTA